MIRDLIRKAFVTNCFFTIAIKKREGIILESLRFDSAKTLPATREEWYADPFLIQEGDHTYLFYEKVHGDLGSIEVAEVMNDCTLSQPVLIFGGDSHYSYPNVFFRDGNWCMIPETSALNEVSLYVAEEFPFRWKKESVLLEKSTVDTTVFQWNDQWYLLTFEPLQNTERVIPLAFRMEGSKLYPMVWESYDPYCVRGAGSPFWYQESLYRPTQVNTDQRYGNCIAFMKINIDKNQYSETRIKELHPDNIKAKGLFFDGLHTYSFSERFEVIDIRCGEIHWSKPFQIIRRVFQNHNS